MIDIQKSVLSFAKIELKKESLVLSGEIKEKFYSGQTDSSLGRRTGAAARGWNVISSDGGLTVSVVNNVKYADQSTEKTITPKKGKLLAIPIDKALTASGVARYDGPRDSGLPDLTFIETRKPGVFLLLHIQAKKGRAKSKADAYFMLVKKVKIPARTKGLTPYVKARTQGIGFKIGAGVNKLINEYSRELVKNAK